MPAWPHRPHPLRTPARAERSAARTEAHYFQTPRRARTVKSPSWALPTTPLPLLAAGTRCFHRGCWLSSCGKDRLVPTCLEDAAWESTGDDAAMDGGDVCARHRRIRARTVTTPHAAAGVSVPSVAAPCTETRCRWRRGRRDVRHLRITLCGTRLRGLRAQPGCLGRSVSNSVGNHRAARFTRVLPALHARSPAPHVCARGSQSIIVCCAVAPLWPQQSGVSLGEGFQLCSLEGRCAQGHRGFSAAWIGWTARTDVAFGPSAAAVRR